MATNNTHVFAVHRPYEEDVSISLNGEVLATLSHDQHGWDGMDAAVSLVEKIANRIGAAVIYIEGDEDE